MGGHDASQSLFRQPLPTKLPKVEAWPIQSTAPAPRGVEETLYEKFGYNDIDEVFQPTATYSRWVQPTQDELANQVEYDMNDADKIWLDGINAERRRDVIEAISYEFFEILMDKLEKEWFDLSKHFPKPASSMLVEDSKCTICDDGECEASNAIVFCDGCNLAVHQDCYGVPYIPEGQWLCRKCTVSPDRDVSCVLCPGSHGAFKQTVGGQWAHLLCAIWINETWVSNTVYMEPIDGIESIPKQRWRLICNLCKKRAGACIQCSKGSCYTAYHVTCAREHGLYLKLGTSSGATTTDGSGGANISYCDKHSKQAFGEEEDEEKAISEELRESRPKKRKLISHGGNVSREASEQLDQSRKKSGLYLTSHGPNEAFTNRDISSSASAGPPKKKKKRLKQEIPIIPRYVYDRVWNYIKPLRCSKKQAFVRMVCRYWSLKRSKRQGAPLLKRLHLEPWTASAATTRDATDLEREQRLDLLLQLRNDLEKVRHLAELVRRRESEKLRRAQLFKQVIDAVIFPQTGLFKATLREIERLDGRHLFSKPVSRTDVPDYYNIVKFPMDWQTMHEKLDQNAYVTAGDFQADVNLVIYNALLYNVPDSLHGKAAIKLRNGVAPLLAKLGEFDDPNSEIHQKHRKYLDAVDDQYIDDLFKLDYPLPEASAATVSIPAAPPPDNVSNDTALLPREGVPEVLSSAVVTANRLQPFSKRKTMLDSLDSAAGFRAPKIFADIFDLSNHLSASQAESSGTSGRVTKESKRSAKISALEKRRQQNRDYRARVKARKLAEKAQAEREAIIAAGGDPDATASVSNLLQDNQTTVAASATSAHGSNLIAPFMKNNEAPHTTAAPAELGLPIVEDGEQAAVTPSWPLESAHSHLVEPRLLEQTTGQWTGQAGGQPAEQLNKRSDEESTGHSTRQWTEQPASQPADYSIETFPSTIHIDNYPLTQLSTTPRINEWGAAIDRVEPPDDHEANLLFNEGWILPAGSKRRRASSANTEHSGPALKRRKASLPPTSVSPMLPTMSLPASAPSASIPLPPLAEQSSSPDLSDKPATGEAQASEPLSSILNHRPAPPSYPEQTYNHGVDADIAEGLTPQNLVLQSLQDESELSDISQSRPSSPVQQSMVSSSHGGPMDPASSVQAQHDLAESALDAALADAAAMIIEPIDVRQVPDNAASESELSELEEDVPLAESLEKRESSSKSTVTERQRRSISQLLPAKSRSSSRKSVSRTNTAVPQSLDRSKLARKGRRPVKPEPEDTDFDDSEETAMADGGNERRPEVATSDGQDKVASRRTPVEVSQDEPKKNTAISQAHEVNTAVPQNERIEPTADSRGHQTRTKPPTNGSRSKSVTASPAVARAPVRKGGRRRKGKRGLKTNGSATGDQSISMRRDGKPSRTISQRKLKEVYSNKPTTFVLERLRLLLPHVRFDSIEEVEDYDLVWARSSKQAPYWPAEVCLDVEERDGDVPQAVLEADPNKHANRQKSEDHKESTSKRVERNFEHYVLVQWFPQMSGTKSSWSWIPFDPEYLTRIGESKEYDAIMQNKFPGIVVKKKKKGADESKRIRAAYEDCFTNMETPPPSDSDEELQELAEV